jgi:Ca-activated chloride channel homolog
VSLASPTLLALLALEGVVVVLYFLRAFRRTHQVSTLFLWNGVKSDPQTRAARIARRVDLLLVLQLLAVALLVLALAGPGLRGRAARLSGLAIVLDASASMATRTPDGPTRYDLALDEARALLAAYPTSPATVIQLSASPQTLAPLSRDREAVLDAMRRARPTAAGDGTPEALQGLLSGVSGSLERIVLFTDHPLVAPVPGVEEHLLGGGDNVGIGAFAVRENPDFPGVTAFVGVSNHTDAYAERTLRVSDGTAAVETALLLPPRSKQTYALPFNATADAFTATLTPRDDFTADDARYFTPHPSSPVRVRWIGTANRYLEAALRAAAQIMLVSRQDGDPVDLTIAYGVDLGSEASGPLLLVHAGLAGTIQLKEDGDGGTVETSALGDPLLSGVDPADFRVRSMAVLEPHATGTAILDVAGSPLLWRGEHAGSPVLVLAADLMATNLPLTVDFPVLVRNLLEELVALPGPTRPEWAVVGRPVALSGREAVLRVTGPDGETVAGEGAQFLLPSSPGLHTVITDQGTYLLAVNVDPAESAPAVTGLDVATVESTAPLAAEVVHPIWPVLVGAAILVLFAEAARYHGISPRRVR